MLDPIGGFNRLREFFIAYLETAFRVRDQKLTEDRRRLMLQIGTLTASPFLEPVPRYTSAAYRLEDLVSRRDDNPLASFDRNARIAFVDLALSGLFPGSDAAEGPLLRKSVYPPYLHQVQVLERGAHNGKPAIVTSGTGSGKTEAFMLPILASIAKEAVGWPAPPEGYLKGRWWADDGTTFQFKRQGEAAARRPAIRALILYPMNALVEDQMTRLRRAMDSEDARKVMDSRFASNRIFFGRYTSAAPVTGHLNHPRLAGDSSEARRRQARIEELRHRLADMERGQSQAREYDAAHSDDEPTRFLFPSTDGAEMLTRWDMQETPPDILVTNASMLSTMLAREVEKPIFEKTKAWLASEPGAQFFLVLDELHLLRGSSGTEVAGLLRALFHRLGLDDRNVRHKLRILASSASMPTEGMAGEQSVKFLDSFFGPFGTYKGPDDGGFDNPDLWRKCIIPGKAVLAGRNRSRAIDGEPFRRLLDVLGGKRLITKLDANAEGFPAAVRECHRALRGADGPADLPGLLKASVEEAAAVLTDGCTNAEASPPIRATSVEGMAERIFGGRGAPHVEALRGLAILRGMGDTLKDRFGVAIEDTTPSFRLHQFVRSIEGLFATPRVDSGNLLFDGLTIERGVTYTADDSGVRRKFELVYCEACGEVFVGGLRGATGTGAAEIELLPSTPDLGRLPESGGVGHYEDLNYDDFAIFWPSTAAPKEPATGEEWLPAVLDTRVGVVMRGAGDGSDIVRGHLFKSGKKRTHNRTGASPGSAAPDSCPACGISYAQRKSPRYSPIRSFRTGFTKTSQLMATELFELLHAAGAMTKAVVFSDSRQDSANAAIRIEQSHYQDLRRQLVVEIARKTSSGPDNSARIAALRRSVENALKRDDFQEVNRLAAEINCLKQASGDRRVPLSLIVEQLAARAGSSTSSMLQRMLDLGIHPSDDAGVAEFKDLTWPEMFRRSSESTLLEWRTTGAKANDIASARNQIIEAQGPHVDEVLFSKTYFALEETGLGYPSLFLEDSPESDRYDAYLRVFADSYRVSSNRWNLDRPPIEWPSGIDVTSKRIKEFVRASKPEDELGELNAVIDFLRGRGHPNGIIDGNALSVFMTAKGDQFWRCDACARVHLHRGTGVCTRCFTRLPEAPSGPVESIWDTNFLAQRVVRDAEDGIPSFRLRCEELTGQTGNPAERLRRFKGIILDTPAGEDAALHRAASEIDLLSVTTTMEVGVDIGTLQTVYQANMPPQRFNYQQRVGRAGRRGQAFSIVLTLCRSRSHDLHYFKNPRAITGDLPPPPFLATGHIDIPLRLLRKVWLSAAFDSIRDECNDGYPGDDQNDTHGEFIPAHLFYSEERWPRELRRNLERLTSYRDGFARVLGAGTEEGWAEKLIEAASVDTLMAQIESKREAGEGYGYGLAQFLAEQGLMPMYGMPTRVRPLYLGLIRKGQNEVEWDKVDRDLDLAIGEFAPGEILVRDKKRYRAVGFTGSLMPPRSYTRKIPIDAQWFEGTYYVAKCRQCDGATVEEPRPQAPTKCSDCDGDIQVDDFRLFYVPTAFRTGLTNKLMKKGEDKPPPPARRSVVAEIRDVETSQVSQTNLTIHAGSGASVLRMNEGPVSDETSEPLGYVVQHVLQNGVPPPRGVAIRWPRLENQFVMPEVVQEWPQDWEPGDQGTTSNIFLVSRKATEALYLGMKSIPDGLALDKFDRKPFGASLRAAAISATHLIVQRAALEMDIDPDEFDALEPRKRKGMPLLQFADHLVNGAGFCRRLAEDTGSGSPMVVDLIRSMVNRPTDDLVGPFLDQTHRKDCGQSCYVCLQRYGNRQYHGLLDWRLGLGFLRALVDRDYRSGLDGRWSETAELSDWLAMATNVRDEVRRLSPTKRDAIEMGSLSLPGLRVRSNGETRFYAVVHPFWRTDVRTAEPFASVYREAGGKEVYFVDSFDAARRPVSALDFARQRPSDR